MNRKRDFIEFLKTVLTETDKVDSHIIEDEKVAKNLKDHGLLPFVSVGGNDRNEFDPGRDAEFRDETDVLVVCAAETDPLYKPDNWVGECAYKCGRRIQANNVKMEKAMCVCIPCAMERMVQGEPS